VASPGYDACIRVIWCKYRAKRKYFNRINGRTTVTGLLAVLRGPEGLQDVTSRFAHGQRDPPEGEAVTGFQLVDKFGNVGEAKFDPGQIVAVAENLFG
jgi:hypothetical protein